MIRVLISILVALLLAVAATLVGYAGVVTWRRAPVPTRPHQPSPPLPEPLPPVLGLAPIPPRASPAPASLAARLPRPTGVATLELRNPSGTPLGVALLDGESGACIGWRSLTDEGSSVAFEGVPVGEHWWVVAREPNAARFVYTSRGRIHVREEADAVSGTAVVDLARHDVAIRLAWLDATETVPPIVRPLLTRADDAAWLFVPPEPLELVASHGVGFDLRGLGAGTYTLALDGADVEPADRELLTFTVPGAERIELRCLRP